MNAEFAPLFKLARAERLQLVEDLWDSIAQEDAQLPVPDWKRDEFAAAQATLPRALCIRPHMGTGQAACSRAA